jgi:Protein of unknown function (DUF3147)
LLTEAIIRFFIGGVVVSVFALLGDITKPKTFAGLFGAAPSIALATLGLTVANKGTGYAATEARSMMAGAVALCLYSLVVSRVLMRHSLPAFAATLSGLTVWFASAIGLWLLCFR